MTKTISTALTGTYNLNSLTAQYTTLTDTGSVSAASGAAIYGSYVSSTFAWTVTNSGTVLGAARGIDIRGNGSGVTNNAGGTIEGYRALYIFGALATVVNHGIIGNAADRYGGLLFETSTVINTGSSATIAASAKAIYLNGGGAVTNGASALITSAYVGVWARQFATTLTNAGTISGGTGAGIRLVSGATVVNQATGVITSNGSIGADFSKSNLAFEHNVTLTNYGSIAGGSGQDAVLFAAGYTSRLIDEPGAIFTGTVDGANTIGGTSISNMELAPGDFTTGTLTGIGSQYVDFEQITVDATAAWQLTGGNALAAGVTLTNNGVLVINDATVTGAGAVVNDGLLVIDPSTVDLGSVTGTGKIAIGAFSTVDLTGTVSAGQTVPLSGRADLLVLGDPVGFAGTIDGFAPADIMQLTGITDVTSATVIANNVLQIIEADTSTLEIHLGQSYSNPNFNHVVDGGNTDITVPCFLVGTRIATPAGERPIETLRIGDELLTRHGAAQRVKWIGRRCYPASVDASLRPILIAPGALADGVPRRTLAVSPMHALLIDGLFIPAVALLNHASIVRDNAAEAVAYLHLEFAAHEVLFAEGAAAESFLDETSRDLFDNAAEYSALYGATDPLPRRAPRTEDGYALDAVRRRLAARAGIRAEPAAPGPLLGHVERLAGGIAEGWVLDQANPGVAVELEAWHRGARLGRVLANRYRSDLDRAGLGTGCCAFRQTLPPGAVLADLALRRARDGTAVPMQA